MPKFISNFRTNTKSSETPSLDPKSKSSEKPISVSRRCAKAIRRVFNPLSKKSDAPNTDYPESDTDSVSSTRLLIIPDGSQNKHKRASAIVPNQIRTAIDDVLGSQAPDRDERDVKTFSKCSGAEKAAVAAVGVTTVIMPLTTFAMMAHYSSKNEIKAEPRYNPLK